MKLLLTAVFATLFVGVDLRADDWTLDSADDWTQNVESSQGATIENGSVSPTETKATVTTKLHSMDKKRSAKSLTLKQSAIWQNWNPAGNVGPINLGDAPVLLTVGPGDYWMFGRYQKRLKGEKNPLPDFSAKPATLDGFDMPLQTTRFENQYNAPGGLKPGKGGYHAWQSHDMKNWVHQGSVTEQFSKWVTSAEFIDGKALDLLRLPKRSGSTRLCR